MSKLGVVIIGRNEGERLVRCIQSVLGNADAIVYVDSGSTDRSVESARALEVETVLLDTTTPFTAARARNTGFQQLMQSHPDIEFVQFVDGDCEIAADWLKHARQELHKRPEIVAVCGRLRELYPERSVYNRLCDMEWDTPVGETLACGGIAMMKVAPLLASGGFRDSLIAGEEPELCARLRAAGGKIIRLDAEMATHDAAITRFGQWWRRTTRAGYAYAAVSRIHGRGPDRFWVREFRSIWFWGCILPVVILAAAPFLPILCLLLLSAYAVLAAKIYRNRRQRGDEPRSASLYTAFCVLAKFPLAIGQTRYFRDRLLQRQQQLIEYKSAESPAAENARIAYLINQYPHVSHSFIRREIRALESYGLSVLRVSIRRPAVGLVDPDDQQEERQTRVLLDSGLFGLVMAFAWTGMTRPIAFCRSAALAWKFGRRSGRLLRSAIYLAEACLLFRWLRREHITHVHAHFGTNPTDVAALASSLGGPTFSFTVHGPEEFDRPLSISLGDKIACAKFVVAISSFGRSQLFRWCVSSDWPRIKVVHCGVDAAFLEAGPLPMPSAPRMVCVGRFAEQKGQLLLIDAAARLAGIGIEFQLVLAGDGPMRPEIEAKINADGLVDKVHITGWLSNDAVRMEIAAARLVVLPSFAEGLPVVLMEALALGRPVVTTYVAGIPELVRHGVNGWLVPPGDVDALVVALAEGLRAGTDQLSTMGRAGAEVVRKNHDARTEAGKLVELFVGKTTTSAPQTVSPSAGGRA